ncbi:MAG TPA: YfiR family protein [Burkholderiaceae bacterium]|nr:YfiR family protein [Burkholderiaceae bacterium]
MLWLVAAGWLLALAGAFAADDSAAPSNGAASDPSRSAVATVVAGIVSYTRWPGEPRAVRLCTVGKGRGVDDLLESGDLGSAQLGVPVLARAGVAAALDECDAIYVGSLPGDGAHRLVKAAIGRPVLLIGEGAEFCTDGGMFCLQPAAPGFAVNLDALARSGLKVNPRVLRIARQPTVSGS